MADAVKPTTPDPPPPSAKPKKPKPPSRRDSQRARDKKERDSIVSHVVNVTFKAIIANNFLVHKYLLGIFTGHE